MYMYIDIYVYIFANIYCRWVDGDAGVMNRDTLVLMMSDMYTYICTCI